MRPKNRNPFLYYLVVDCDGNPIDNPSCGSKAVRFESEDFPFLSYTISEV